MFTTSGEVESKKEHTLEELLPMSDAFDVDDILSHQKITDVDCLVYLERERRILEIYKEYGTYSHHKPHWALITKQPVWDLHTLKSLKTHQLERYQPPTMLQAITYLLTIPNDTTFVTRCKDRFEHAHLVVGPRSPQEKIKIDIFSSCTKVALVRLLSS